MNPKRGYIDGSVYIGHAHHPVDVTSIRFGAVEGNSVEAEFEMQFLFEFEGLDNYQNMPCNFHAWIFQSALNDTGSTDE